MEIIKNPKKMCHEIAGYVERMCDIINWHKLNKPSELVLSLSLSPSPSFSLSSLSLSLSLSLCALSFLIADRSLYLNESWDLAERRWGKELREFRRTAKNGGVEFDISKIPDIYDNIKVRGADPSTFFILLPSTSSFIYWLLSDE